MGFGTREAGLLGALSGAGRAGGGALGGGGAVCGAATAGEAAATLLSRKAVTAHALYYGFLGSTEAGLESFESAIRMSHGPAHLTRRVNTYNKNSLGRTTGGG
ncbi:MAG: hypothetical protein QW837_09615 [Conexivisphaerales archaeon]